VVVMKRTIFWDITPCGLLEFNTTFSGLYGVMISIHFSCIRSPFLGRLCGLVVRVSGYRSRDPGFDSRCYQIF
jgi:hypothetical protein